MKKQMLAAAIGGAMLASCSKEPTVHPPANTVESRSIVYQVYADPLERTYDPSLTDAAIKLVVMRASLRDASPVLVWDSMVPMRTLASYPGPKEPIQITKKFEVNGGQEFLHIMYHKIYRRDQQLTVKDFTESFASGENSKHINISL